MAEVKQWRGKTSGGKFGQKFLLTTLKYVRVTAFYPWLLLIIPFCLLFARKPNRALYRYFHDIRGYNRWKAFRSTARNAHTFGKVVIDKFAIWAGRSDQFTIDLHGGEVIEEAVSSNKGIIIAGSHIGNFELLGACLKQGKKPINAIVFGGESRMLQQSRSDVFGQKNIKLIPVADDMSHLFAIKNALDAGEIVTILCDRIFGSPKKQTIKFIGHDADFPAGPFRLAALMDIPVFSAFVMKEKGRHYACDIVPIHSTGESEKDRMTSLVVNYAKSIEDKLKQYPEQWFNLYDFWNLESSKENQ